MERQILETLNNIIQPEVIDSAAAIENKPLRIINQVPIMHSPGEISQVANMFDSRIFEENSTTAEPNIEFHIHAFLSPNGATGAPSQRRSAR
jgi:hypothetical protein